MMYPADGGDKRVRDDRPSLTAEWVCLVRAFDAARPDALIGDRWAADFLSAPSRAVLGVARRAGRLPPTPLTDLVRLRHRAIDDALRDSLDRGVAQVVILGAGYDTRALRMADRLHGPVFEVDHPATAARKARLAAGLDTPTVDLRRVSVDFTRQDLGERLREHGFAEGAPTFVAWEGVSMYLDEAAIRRTLAVLRALAPTTLAMDFLGFGPGPSGWTGRAGAAGFRLFGEPITFSATPDEARALLADEGFDVTSCDDAAALRRRYGTGRPAPWLYVVTAATRSRR